MVLGFLGVVGLRKDSSDPEFHFTRNASPRTRKLEKRVARVCRDHHPSSKYGKQFACFFGVQNGRIGISSNWSRDELYRLIKRYNSESQRESFYELCDELGVYVDQDAIESLRISDLRRRGRKRRNY